MATYTMKDFINKNIVVRVGQKHVKEFLEMCDKHGLMWLNGNKALDDIPKEYGESLSISLGFNRPNCLEFCWDGWYADEGWKVVDFKDLVTTPRYQIILECDGDVTTAKMTINGKETKVATAKRNPEDKFDWKTGASVAFERLWEKIREKKDGEFKIGDRVVCIGIMSNNPKTKGAHGRVVADDCYMERLGVEFDEYIEGHTCADRAKSGHGWYVDPGLLRHEDPDYKTDKNDAEKKDEVKKKFEVGDRVVCVGETDNNQKIVNCHGTVICDADRPRVGVEFDKHVDGHNCFTNGKHNRCWFCDRDTLRHETSPSKTVKEVKPVDDVKKVERKAKVGEWVEIVDPEGQENERYKKGDILLVKQITPYGNVKLSCGGEVAFEHEYVVLEGYSPVKEVKRQARTGEYIKLVSTMYSFDKVGDILKATDPIGYGACHVLEKDRPTPSGSSDDDKFFPWCYPNEYYVVLEGYEPHKTEVKEVKRKAKMGEYIKIVNSWVTNGLYTNGDIIVVDEFYREKDGKVMIRDPKRPNYHWIQIMPSEYVVLEGYEPGMEV